MAKVTAISIDHHFREITFYTDDDVKHKFQKYSPQSPIAKVVALLEQLLKAEVYNK